MPPCRVRSAGSPSCRPRHTQWRDLHEGLRGRDVAAVDVRTPHTDARVRRGRRMVRAIAFSSNASGTDGHLGDECGWHRANETSRTTGSTTASRTGRRMDPGSPTRSTQGSGDLDWTSGSMNADGSGKANLTSVDTRHLARTRTLRGRRTGRGSRSVES